MNQNIQSPFGAQVQVLSRADWLRQPETQNLVAELQKQADHDVKLAVTRATEGNNNAVVNLAIAAGIKLAIKTHIERAS